MQKTSVLLACLLAVACGNPSDPEGWAKRAVSRSRLDEKIEALQQVRKAPGDRRAAVPALVETLKDRETHPRARAEAAVALGEIGDPSAAAPLLAAIAEGNDRDNAESNRRIAEALGALRAKEAVPKLEELARSPNGYLQVAAVDALGEIGDPAAVDTLVEIATRDSVEPFIAKKALMALGRIGDPRAARTVLRMLFEERPGVSFFDAASFAVSQIGAPMAAPLLAVLEGRDAELARWASTRGVVPGALYAKSAQLLGDVGGPDAVPALVQKLGYRDADEGLAVYVRVFAAESLGRMRAKEAVRPLAELAGRERDPDARDRYCDALARIGDAGAVPVLRSATASGDFQLREGPLTAISRLGGKDEAELVAAAERKDCERGCDPARRAAYAGMRARLSAAATCGADARCWSEKLGDASPAVRDRAALEVGRAGDPALAPALVAAAVLPVGSEADLAARYHAVLALGWIASKGKLGPAGADAAAKLDAMVAADRGRTLTAGVNEEAARLASRLRRG